MPRRRERKLATPGWQKHKKKAEGGCDGGAHLTLPQRLRMRSKVLSDVLFGVLKMITMSRSVARYDGNDGCKSFSIFTTDADSDGDATATWTNLWRPFAPTWPRGTRRIQIAHRAHHHEAGGRPNCPPSRIAANFPGQIKEGPAMSGHHRDFTLPLVISGKRG